MKASFIIILGVSPRKVTAVKLLQLAKALYQIAFTLSGMVILFRLVQPEKRNAPIPVTPSGIVILDRLVQL